MKKMTQTHKVDDDDGFGQSRKIAATIKLACVESLHYQSLKCVTFFCFCISFYVCVLATGGGGN